MIYLETNALYKLHNRFSTNLFYNRYTYTSFLAILEIISGLNFDDFARRKSILTNIQSSGIEVDWDTPREKITNAFIAIELKDEKYKSDIREMFRLVCLSSNFDELKRSIAESTISASIDDLAKDEAALSRHIESDGLTRKFIAEVNRINRKILRSDWYDDIGKPKQQNLEKLKQFRISQMAKWIWEHSTPNSSEQDGVQTLVESYNRSIEYYYLADCFLEMERMFSGREIGRNDYLDISHLLYINGSKFVSDDSIFKSMRDYVPLSLYSCNDIIRLANTY